MPYLPNAPLDFILPLISSVDPFSFLYHKCAHSHECFQWDFHFSLSGTLWYLLLLLLASFGTLPPWPLSFKQNKQVDAFLPFLKYTLPFLLLCLQCSPVVFCLFCSSYTIIHTSRWFGFPQGLVLVLFSLEINQSNSNVFGQREWQNETPNWLLWKIWK